MRNWPAESACDELRQYRRHMMSTSTTQKFVFELFHNKFQEPEKEGIKKATVISPPMQWAPSC